LVLAVKGIAAEEAIKRAGIDLLKNKIILDTTNPIAEVPPTNGVISFFTTLEESLMERSRFSEWDKRPRAGCARVRSLILRQP
jgi:hypothetical protein